MLSRIGVRIWRFARFADLVRTFRTETSSLFARRNQLGPVVEKLLNRWCREAMLLYTGTPATSKSCDQGDDKDHQEDKEEELCNSGRCHRHAPESENGCDDCDDQKYQRPIQHIASSRLGRISNLRKKHSQSPLCWRSGLRCTSKRDLL